MSNPAPRRHLPLIQNSPREIEIQQKTGSLRRAAVGTLTTILAWAPLAALSQYASAKWFELRFRNSSEALDLWLKSSAFSDRIGYYLLILVLPLSAFLLSAALGGLAIARVHEKSVWSDAALGGLGSAIFAWVLTSFRLGMVSSAPVLIFGGLIGFLTAAAGYRLAQSSAR